MASRTRTDLYNIAADIACETAIATMLALDVPSDGVKPVATNRKEAMRFLLRRLVRKERDNKLRVIVANSLTGEAVS
jgi:hypothetical protein